MRNIKRLICSLLAAVMVLTMLPATALAAEAGATSASNEYITVSVNNQTGRFAIRTVDGQPIRKGDQNSNLTFTEDDTSFSTFRINGTDYIFGNKYDITSMNILSDITTPQLIRNEDGSQTISTTWTLKKSGAAMVSVEQLITLYPKNETTKTGNVLVTYNVENLSDAQVEVGSRVLLDVMLGSNDGPVYHNGASTAGNTVERTFVRGLAGKYDAGEITSVDGVALDENKLPIYTMDPYWVIKDADTGTSLDTKIYAYGFNNFSDGDEDDLVDEIKVGHWVGMSNTKFDYTVDRNLDFATDTNKYGSADMAVAYYWYEETMAPAGGGDASKQMYQVTYGLGDIIENSGVFAIQYLDQVDQLQVTEDQMSYQGDGVFCITVEAENLAQYNMYHNAVTCTLTLDSGLDFVVMENGRPKKVNGKVVTTSEGRSSTNTYKKSPTIADYEAMDAYEKSHGGAAHPTLGKVAPGDKMIFTFYVVATGRSWPTTKQYMAEVSSSELNDKYQASIDDESLRALYKCSKSDIIFLPPVGQAVQTQVFGMTPEECFYEDEKIITVNLTNIGAYDVGTKGLPDTATFDLFIVNAVDGTRYQVDVQSSVTKVDPGDGSTGDLRVTYRGGNIVDGEGRIIETKYASDPTLPEGAYYVEARFKPQAGMTAEEAALYDFKTEQTFLSSLDEAARMRISGMLAVGKYQQELPAEKFAAYTSIVNGLSTVAQSIDPTYEGYEALKEWGESAPMYVYEMLNSEDELAAFEDSLGEEGELMLLIEGMIKEQDGSIIVDTSTEPAVINKCITYSGSDLTLNWSGEFMDMLGLIGGKLPGGITGKINDFTFDGETGFGCLSVNGDGELCITGSGFVFHSGEWSVDFYNGFDKALSPGDEEDPEEEEDEKKEDADNGMLEFATGVISGQLNPMKVITIDSVYFNRLSLFSLPAFSVGGFTVEFREFTLSREEDDFLVSFGGTLDFKIVTADVKNVYFDTLGYYGIESELKFALPASIGLLEGGDDKTGGTVTVNDYRSGVAKTSEYGIEFKASIKDKIGVECELKFKKVPDGRVLPDTIIFGAEFPDPGILLTGATYLTSVKGGLQELADTIAGTGGTIPLTIVAGVGVTFGVDPAKFEGKIDLTLKMTGIKLEGSLKFGGQEMLTYAMIQAQWSSPWFVQCKAEVNVLGWGVIVGQLRLFIGENTELNRTDFEGFVSAALQVPDSIPVVGGLTLGRISLGMDNDKMYGSVRVGVGVISVGLGVTYYWSGDIEITTDGEGLPEDEALSYLLVTDPDSGEQQLIGIGCGIKTLACSATGADGQEIEFHSLGDGMQMIEACGSAVGLAPIDINDDGTVHSIPVSSAYSAEAPADALIMVEYFGEQPALTLKDSSGNTWNVHYYTLGETASAPLPANCLCGFTQERTVDGVTEKYAYIVVPYEQLKAVDTNWTLNSTATVETTLLSTPRGADISGVTLTDLGGNNINASVSTSNVSAGDIVRLYLTDEAESSAVEYVDDGKGGKVPVNKTSEAGVKIAETAVAEADFTQPGGRDAVVSRDISLESCNILGETSNVCQLLESGDYYLRAELVSGLSYSSKTDNDHPIAIYDSLAPESMGGVTVENAGNGMFAISFDAVSQKAGQSAMELGYVVDFYQMDGADKVVWENLGGMYYTDAELSAAAEGGSRYTVRAGGWSLADTGERVGLEPGGKYIVRVRAVNLDSDENYHYTRASESAETTLRVPTPPELTVSCAAKGASVTAPTDYEDFWSVSVPAKTPTLSIGANAENIVVNVWNGAENYGKITGGAISLSRLASDGTFPLELRAENEYGDTSTTMVYLTIDTIAPMLYIDSPVTGQRTESGRIRVAGTTDGGGDVELTVYVDGAETGTPVAVDPADGSFDSLVSVSSEEPTVSLKLVAADAAGNSDTAKVDITNDSYKVPQGIVLREIAPLAKGNSTRLQAVMRYAGGSEAPISGSGLSFESWKGSSVSVRSDGTVFAASDGATIVKATYDTGTAKFETMLMVRVSGAGGDDAGGESIGGGGIGGGGAGGGTSGGDTGEEPGENTKIEIADSRTDINGSGVPAELDGNGELIINAGPGSVVNGGSEIVTEYGAGSFLVNISGDAASKLGENGAVIVDTPLGRIEIPASQIPAGGCAIRISPNDGAAALRAKNAVGGAEGAAILGSGRGVTVEVSGTDFTGEALIAIPEEVRVDELTAVILVTPDGQWTPVTWKLDMQGNTAYVKIANLGEGHVVFLGVQADFSDLSENYWATSSILGAAGKMFILGMGDGTFDPSSDVTRAQFAAILLRTGGLMTAPVSGKTLKDVSADHWSYRPLSIANDLGIITGYEDGTIRGGDGIFREQAMVMTGRLLRAIGITEQLTEEEIEACLAGYADAGQLQSWARADAALCVKWGIIAGNGGELDLASNLTRAQCGAISSRLDAVLVDRLLS